MNCQLPWFQHLVETCICVLCATKRGHWEKFLISRRERPADLLDQSLFCRLSDGQMEQKIHQRANDVATPYSITIPPVDLTELISTRLHISCGQS